MAVGGPVLGVVLCGGASRRMGVDKATLEIDGVAMARRVADVLVAGGCADVMAVGGDAAGLAQLGLRTVEDRWPGEGPLGGIIVALERMNGPVLVTACDLPWLDSSTVERLLASSRAHPDGQVFVADSGRVEPLCAVWTPSVLPSLHEQFRMGERAVLRALDGLEVVRCPVEQLPLTNVNRPEDLPPR